MKAPDTLWELVFLMVILKIPIVYLCCVVWFAIKAEPRGRGGPAGVRAMPDGPLPSFDRYRRRRAQPAAAPARRPGPGLSRARHAPRSRAAVGSPIVNVDGEIYREDEGRNTAETVAGYLSALAIFVSVLGIVWHPLRLILPSIVIALIAAGMAGQGRKLQLAAVMISAVCFFLGLTIAVATSHPLC